MTDTLSALLESAHTQLNAGQLNAARVSFEKILAYAPAHPDALRAMGSLLMRLGRHPAALEYFNHVLNLQPNDVLSHLSIARISKEAGQPGSAIDWYKRTLKVAPDSMEAASELSHLLTPEQPLAALELLERALSFHPDSVQLHYDMGQAYAQLRRYAQAVHHYERAHALAPESPDAANNLGLALEAVGKMDEAMALYRALLQAHPTYHNALLNLSLLLLLTGQLAEGWAAYESRFSLHLTQRYFYLPKFPCPLWQGEPLQGKRILVLGEQGLGDQIQFLRFAQHLSDAGATVDVTVDAPLLQLAKTATGIHDAATAFTLDGNYDYWVMMMSIPHCLKITSEDQYAQHAPYLRLPAPATSRFQDLINQHAQGKLRIGLVWAGNSSHTKDWNRSIKLDAFAALAQNPDVALFSLQKGAPTAELETLAWRDQIFDLGSSCNDLTDTAAVLSQLDLLITVDTSVAHLSGALGLDAWVLIGVCPDWRWGLEGEKTAWYRSLRLVRQHELGRWDDIIEQLVREIGQATHSLKKPHPIPSLERANTPQTAAPARPLTTLDIIDAPPEAQPRLTPPKSRARTKKSTQRA
ncbi:MULTISPECIES: tetratricopeptide repeat-containing glycosyltransferase family protein [unclassified Caballeronia]|uniref:tetratricopeptide repeat-containing glycosyltransferase family protein n=1 Tax=unclassified Caballeronia TaxID=2646786 RepID=UPI002029698D|nr:MULTISPECIES: tetratricopeptide repeat-containing glycosyltransferase family protein [unclassified Caballeronia]